MKRLIWIIALAGVASAQWQDPPASGYTALNSFLNALSAATPVTSLPPTCRVGKDLFVLTTTSPGTLEYCDAPNHLTPVPLQYSALSGIPTNFTPSAHAATHGSGGGDAISIDWSQIATGKPTTFAPVNTGDWAGTWQTHAPAYFQTAIAGAPGTWPSTFAPINTGDWAGTWQTYAPSHFQTAIAGGTQDQVLNGLFGWLSLVNCGDSSHGLGYSTVTHTLTCQAITGAGGGLADPGANGIIKRTSANTTAPAVAGTDYQAAISGAPGSWPSTFAPAAHAASHAAGGGDAVTLTEAQITGLTTDLAEKQAAISGAPGTWPSTFTPAAHAASHAAGGGDAVTLTEAQVTSLVSDLAAKQAAITSTSTNPSGTTCSAVGLMVYMTPTPKQWWGCLAPGDLWQLINSSDLQGTGQITLAVGTQASITTPAAGSYTLFIDSADNTAKLMDSTRAVTAIGGTGGGGDAISSPNGTINVGGTSSATTIDIKPAAASVLGGVNSKDCSGTGHVQKINTDGSITCSGDSGGAVQEHTLPFVIDGAGGAAIAAGSGYIGQVSGTCTIYAWSLAADQVGSITLELDAHANSAPPATPTIPNTTTDKISGSVPMTLSSAQSASGTTFTGWTTSRTIWDSIVVNVTSATTVTHVTGQVFCH